MAHEPVSVATPARLPVPPAFQRKLLNALASAIAQNDSLALDLRLRLSETLRGASRGLLWSRLFALVLPLYALCLLPPTLPLLTGVFCALITIGALALASVCARVVFERHFVATLWTTIDALQIPMQWVAQWLERGNFERLFWEVAHRPAAPGDAADASRES